MANDLKYYSIYSIERIRQQRFTLSILKFCKDSSPMLPVSPYNEPNRCILFGHNRFQLIFFNGENVKRLLVHGFIIPWLAGSSLAYGPHFHAYLKPRSGAHFIKYNHQLSN